VSFRTKATASYCRHEKTENLSAAKLSQKEDYGKLTKQKEMTLGRNLGPLARQNGHGKQRLVNTISSFLEFSKLHLIQKLWDCRGSKCVKIFKAAIFQEEAMSTRCHA
jgi:hypothetical protein